MLLNHFTDEPLTTKRFSKGELIYRQDAPARYFYEVTEGEIAIVNSNNEGKEFIQGLYKAGDCFGVAALVCEMTYTSSAIANTPCEVYVLPNDRFFQLLKANYDFHLSITRIVSRQLQYKTMMLEEIAIEEGEHRLLTLIHYLMSRINPDNNALDITKQQLADMTGLRVETVIKILKRIERQGKIATHRGQITCLSGKRHPL